MQLPVARALPCTLVSQPVSPMAGWYHRCVERANLQIRSGLGLRYWGYRHNQDYFSLGNGDYFSPSHYTSIGLPLTMAWRSANWSALIDASARWSWAGFNPSRRFPIERLISIPHPAGRAAGSGQSGHDRCRAVAERRDAQPGAGGTTASRPGAPVRCPLGAVLCVHRPAQPGPCTELWTTLCPLQFPPPGG